IVAGASVDSGGMTFAPGTGFTLRDAAIAATSGDEDESITTTGSVVPAMSWGPSAQHWVMAAASFLPSGTGGGTGSTVSVLTYHNDLARTGQNLNETNLTPANVNTATFGKKFTDPVDGFIYAQPLYMPNLAVSGKGTHNAVFVATENDTVYAFDADASGSPLWQTSLLLPGEQPLAITDYDSTGGCTDLITTTGVTGTPVIDPSTNTLYVIANSKTSSSGPFHQRLHAIDITTGLEKAGSPVEVQATVSGTGDGGSTVTFSPLMQLQRPGLALANGVVYFGFGSHCDIQTYHGWLFAYSASSLNQLAVYVTTANGAEGAIWQAGGAPSIDSANNIFVAIGNGTFDANTNGVDYGDSYLKLALSGSTVTVQDFFTPFNQAQLFSADLDLGSSAPVLLPDSAGSAAHPHLMIGAGKGGTIYLVDRDNMGKFNSSTNNVVQFIDNAIGNSSSGENFSTAAYWNGFVYYGGVSDKLKAFAITNGALSTSPTSQATTVFGFPGSTPAISANGTSNGIVWALQLDHFTGGPAILHAYDATNLSTELYNSTQAANSRDQADPAVKFTVPTIANGKVYFGTRDHLDVYGSLP
ncbi:MAG: hypothetical protein ACRD50_10800, partial [Candidatus Acidiferrales bacterium]